MRSFRTFGRVSFDRTAVTIRRTPLVAYLARTNISNFSARTRNMSIDDGLTMAGIVPMSCIDEQPKANGSRPHRTCACTDSHIWRLRSGRAPYRQCRYSVEIIMDEITWNFMKLAVESSWNCGLKASFVNSGDIVELNRIPLLVLYWCGTSEKKEVLTVQRSVAVKKQCKKCVVNGYSNSSGQMITVTSIMNEKMAKRVFLKSHRIILRAFRTKMKHFEKRREKFLKRYWKVIAVFMTLFLWNFIVMRNVQMLKIISICISSTA